jgi:hypothetical protein
VRPHQAKSRDHLINDSVVAAVLLHLHQGRIENLEEPQSELVLEALRRSTRRLDGNASPEDIADYVQSYSVEQLDGLAVNVKGIYHELAFVELENSDGDAWNAEVFAATNHPASDAVLHHSGTGEEVLVQLKATDSVNYAAKASHEHPEVLVLATDEAVDPSRGVYASGFSNAELDERVQSTLDELNHTGMPLEEASVAASVAVLVGGGGVWRKWRRGEKLHAAELGSLGKDVMKAAGRNVVLVALSTTPAAPLVTLYLTGCLAKHGWELIARDTEAGSQTPKILRARPLQLTEEGSGS